MQRLTAQLAEEGGSGKVVLLEKGAYEGMDVCLMPVFLPVTRSSPLS